MIDSKDRPSPWPLLFSELAGTALLVLIGLSLVTVMFGTGLDAGPHTLSLRIAPTTSSTGHAIRIMRFAAN